MPLIALPPEVLLCFLDHLPLESDRQCLRYTCIKLRSFIPPSPRSEPVPAEHAKRFIHNRWKSYDQQISFLSRLPLSPLQKPCLVCARVISPHLKFYIVGYYEADRCFDCSRRDAEKNNAEKAWKFEISVWGAKDSEEGGKGGDGHGGKDAVLEELDEGKEAGLDTVEGVGGSKDGKEEAECQDGKADVNVLAS